MIKNGQRYNIENYTLGGVLIVEGTAQITTVFRTFKLDDGTAADCMVRFDCDDHDVKRMVKEKNFIAV